MTMASKSQTLQDHLSACFSSVLYHRTSLVHQHNLFAYAVATIVIRLLTFRLLLDQRTLNITITIIRINVNPVNPITDKGMANPSFSVKYKENW